MYYHQWCARSNLFIGPIEPKIKIIKLYPPKPGPNFFVWNPNLVRIFLLEAWTSLSTFFFSSSNLFCIFFCLNTHPVYKLYEKSLDLSKAVVFVQALPCIVKQRTTYNRTEKKIMGWVQGRIGPLRSVLISGRY